METNPNTNKWIRMSVHVIMLQVGASTVPDMWHFYTQTVHDRCRSSQRSSAPKGFSEHLGIMFQFIWPESGRTLPGHKGYPTKLLRARRHGCMHEHYYTLGMLKTSGTITNEGLVFIF